MADKDRVKGPAHHPESTVQEGVGTLKEDEAKRAKETAGKPGGTAQDSDKAHAAAKRG